MGVRGNALEQTSETGSQAGAEAGRTEAGRAEGTEAERAEGRVETGRTEAERTERAETGRAEAGRAETENEAEVIYDVRWKDTLFVAAIDASTTEAASRPSPLWEHDHADKTPCRRTQRRWINHAGRLLGLAIDLSQDMADKVCWELGIAGYDHRKAREAWAEARDMRRRARAVLSILALLEIDGKVYQRILASGHLTGAMATGYIWDCEVSRRLFPTLGTSQGCGGRSPP